MKKFGVRIIGASPERMWAVWAHMPALLALPQHQIRAMSASQQKSTLSC